MRLGLTRQQRRVAKALVAYLMLALWCITAAQVASPRLHHLLHKDSQKSTHECLVTQLTKSAPMAGGTPIVVAAPALTCVDAFCSELQYFPRFRLSGLAQSRSSCSFFFNQGYWLESGLTTPALFS